MVPALPPKPSVWDVYRQLREPEPQHTPMQSAVTGLRHNAEGGVVGGILGLIHGEFGSLDIQGKYPVDGIAALVLYALSVRDAGKPEGFASDLRAMSQSCTTTLLYRKAREWRENAKKPRTEQTQSSAPAFRDPIVEAGRAVGLSPGESR